MAEQLTLADIVPLQLPSQQPGVRAEASVMAPVGDGVRDISLLLRGPRSGDLSCWYDTYDGDHAHETDWYGLHLGQETELNTIFFMHGPIFAVAGWWTSLSVDYIDHRGAWHEVPSITITPPYDFRDDRGERRPFQAFQISFAPLRTRSIRIRGTPGGSIRVTTLAYLAAGRLSGAQADQYRAALRAPFPRMFELLPPNELWDLISSLSDVTGIAFDVQCREGLGLDHFLDRARYQRFHDRHAALQDPSSLYRLLGDSEGWAVFGREILEARAVAMRSHQPELRGHHGGMVWIAVPLLEEQSVLGTIENRNLMGLDALDEAWHAATRARLELDSTAYMAALRAVPIYDAGRLEAIVRLVQSTSRLSQEQIRRSAEISALRSTVEELATPILPIWPGVLAVPLIGRVDQARADQLIRSVLEGISRSATRVVILDVTGVQLIDQHVAMRLAELIRTTRLLGATSVVSGIRPEVADAIVSTGADLDGATTYPTLQSALADVIRQRSLVRLK